MANPAMNSEKNVVAYSDRMRHLMALVRKISVTDVNVLIKGESGTGKDFLAAMVHQMSHRAAGPLVKIDCSNLPRDLLESELFGYEKGAFTDAKESKPGRIELAQGGTLVLDDIAQVDLSSQAKFLRVIEDKRTQRLGSVKSWQIDTRIITLTNVDLEHAVASHTFREDLFYRLNVISFTVPPLRERKKDIIPLATLFLKRFNRKHRKEIKGLSDESSNILLNYNYPGNIRELQNMLERAVILANNGEVLPADVFPFHVRFAVYFSGPSMVSLAELERLYIKEVLDYTNGSRSKAAQILGIHRKTLLEKRKLYGIK